MVALQRKKDAAGGQHLRFMISTWRRRTAMSSNPSLAQAAHDRAPQTAARQLRIAVLVPCYNEETAIAKVVADFRAALPQAAVYVYDNNSRDLTVHMARAAGAVVRSELHQGKGHVVRRMFSDIEADVYVLVDGDATYDAASAPSLIDALVTDSLDLVSAVRVDASQGAYRSGHRFGNWMLT